MPDEVNEDSFSQNILTSNSFIWIYITLSYLLSCLCLSKQLKIAKKITCSNVINSIQFLLSNIEIGFMFVADDK